MYAFRNYTTMRVLQVVGFLGTLFGLSRIIAAGVSDQHFVMPILITAIFVIVGITASLLATYYKSKEGQTGDRQRQALEALEKIAKQKR